MRQWPAVFIDNAARNDDALAERFARMLPREIECLYVDEFLTKNRPRNFRNRMRQMHKRLRRRTLLRRNIWWMQILRLGAGVITAIGSNRCHGADSNS